MPRIVWTRLLILLIALPIGSCFGRDEACMTCPPENSASIDVVVARSGEIDSVHVRVDGGSRITVKRDKRGSIGGLAAGDRVVEVVRWYEDLGIVTSKTTTFTIRLEAGETRVILMHNDFPQVAGAAPGDAPMPALPTLHPGWARA